MTAAVAVARADASRRASAAKTPIALGIFAVLALLLLVSSRATASPRSRSPRPARSRCPDVRLPVRGTGIVVTVLAVLLAVGAAVLVRLRSAQPRAGTSSSFTLLLVVGFLAWATAGQRLPIVGLLTGSLALAAPLIFGALGGVVSERVGIVNIAIEGQLLAGAFVSAVLASITKNLFVGLSVRSSQGRWSRSCSRRCRSSTS